VTINSDGTVDFASPSVESIGKLRGLGRFLLVAGEKLIDAASEMSTELRKHESSRGSQAAGACLHTCGVSLRDAASALMTMRWAEADTFIGTARQQCVGLLPKEHLLALQRRLAGDTVPVPDVGAALRALSSVLEGQAEGPLAALQDTLSEAASALRAAARLFTQPASVRPAGRDAAVLRRCGAVAAAAAAAGVPLQLAREIAQSLAFPREGDVRGALRALATKFHPDRHPGREEEVIVAFLHVQRLREQNSWGA